MIVHIRATYFTGDALLRGGKYHDGSTAIQAVDPETQEPLFVATVCVDEPLAEGCVWLKGWSENEGIPEALVEAGVVELTGRTCSTGYVQAEEARLLVEID